MLMPQITGYWKILFLFIGMILFGLLSIQVGIFLAYIFDLHLIKGLRLELAIFCVLAGGYIIFFKKSFSLSHKESMRIVGTLIIGFGILVGILAFEKVVLYERKCLVTYVNNGRHSTFTKSLYCGGDVHSFGIGTKSLDGSRLNKGECYKLIVNKRDNTIYEYTQITCEENNQ